MVCLFDVCLFQLKQIRRLSSLCVLFVCCLLQLQQTSLFVVCLLHDGTVLASKNHARGAKNESGMEIANPPRKFVCDS
jgi:hypothetical protein